MICRRACQCYPMTGVDKNTFHPSKTFSTYGMSPQGARHNSPWLILLLCHFSDGVFLLRKLSFAMF